MADPSNEFPLDLSSKILYEPQIVAIRNESKELVVIQVRVPKKVSRKLIHLKDRTGDVSMSAYCRRILTEYVERNHGKTK